MNGNVPSAGVFAIAASACKCLVFLHYRVPISHFDSVIFFFLLLGFVESFLMDLEIECLGRSEAIGQLGFLSTLQRQLGFLQSLKCCSLRALKIQVLRGLCQMKAPH